MLNNCAPEISDRPLSNDNDNLRILSPSIWGPIQARVNAIRHAADGSTADRDSATAMIKVDTIFIAFRNALDEVLSDMGTNLKETNDNQLKKCLENMSDKEHERYRKSIF